VTELEQALGVLAWELDVPETPDLTTRVLAQIEPRAPRRVERSRWIVAVTVVVLAALAATLAIPDARAALFRLLSIGGERIELVDELPEIPVQDDLELSLGERVTLEEGRRRSSFSVRELDESPDRVYLGERGTVWFLHGTPALPRLLVAQTPLDFVNEDLLVQKLAGPGTRVERTDVDGSPAVFLSGEVHLVLLIDEYGYVVEESARLARDVLVWDRDGVAYRLEGDFDLEKALRLARSLG